MAQELSDMQRKGLNPISPTAYQFIKFGEIPVNEYTGSPTVEIPLYNIDIRGFSLPIKLQYHSKGIRVSEEADWVGLGWDLSLGSITQITNGLDDLNRTYKKVNIPYILSRYPTIYPYSSTTAPTYTDMDIDNTSNDYLADKTYSFLTFQHSTVGYDGWNVTNFVDFDDISNTTDYEKDIFIANVLGEQLYILVKPIFYGTGYISPSTTFTVLNKKGYNISILEPTLGLKIWKIINPSGITCYFEEIDNITNGSSTIYNDTSLSDQETLLSSASNQISVLSSNIPSSAVHASSIWQITKIINIYGDTIKFNYSAKNTLVSTNYSYVWKVGTGNVTRQCALDGSGVLGCDVGPFLGEHPAYLTNGDVNSVVNNSTVSYQERSYLKSISFNNNTISFNTSTRTDWTNAQKLDSIVIVNSQQQKIKSIQLNYDYFQSSYTGRGYKGNVQEKSNRLRLNSVICQKEEKYNFTYNSTPLPPKNSFGIDYWGYYNGQINNSTPFPNVIDFKDRYTYDTAKESLYNGRCGKLYAVNDYCKAGILEKIQYPTGGYSRFCYSLNSFDNYKVPNDPAINNTIQYFGNGLKIDSIINYNNNGSIATIKYFQYEKGKLQTPLRYFLNKPETYCQMGDGNASFNYAFTFNATMFNISTNNYFCANPTGDGTGVGYGKVSTWIINARTKAFENGKIVHYYTNNPEIINNMPPELIEELPTYHKGFGNGTLLREEITDNANKIMNATQYAYKLSYDKPIEYNSRRTSKGYWLTGATSRKEVMIAYYPLYKPETILNNKQKADYFSTDSVVTSDLYNYNSYNIINSKSMTTSNTFQGKSESYLYPYDIYNNTSYAQAQRDIMGTLISQNRLDEKIQIESTTYTKGIGSPRTQYAEYDATKLLPNVIKTRMGYNNPLETNLTLLYDSKKNIVEKREKDNIPTTYLWGYNSQYPIAEIKNTTYDQVKAVLGVDPEVLAASSSPDISKVDALRTKFPSALITSYNYKPMVGMTSVTDPRGITTRYVYDPNNRLTLVRDNNINIVNQYRYAYQNMGENTGIGTTSPLSATLIKDGTTYYKVSDVASVSVTGGSGNFGYSWYLKNSGGSTIQSSINSSSSQFNFSCTEGGSLTLQCVITDYLTNNSITVTKSITCLYPPLAANITTNSTSYYSIQSTGMAAASTYIATANISGGSPSQYCCWSLLDTSNNTLQSYTGGNSFSFVCTKRGTLIINCKVVDNIMNTNIIVTKTITSL
jgi:YD repeat-containing protein